MGIGRSHSLDLADSGSVIASAHPGIYSCLGVADAYFDPVNAENTNPVMDFEVPFSNEVHV